VWWRPHFHRHQWFVPEYIRTLDSTALNCLLISEFSTKIVHVFLFSRYSDWLQAVGPRCRSSSPGRVQNFLFSTSSRPGLGSTQPPMQWEPGALSQGVKRRGSETNHSPLTSAEFKKIWIYTSRDQRNESPRPLISVFYTGAATVLSSNSSIILTRLSGPRSRPTTSQKIWWTHYFPENLVVPRIETGTYGSVARNSWTLDHKGGQ
jgi:hypothetical protein